MVDFAPSIEMIVVGRATCEHCVRDFLIENDLPVRLPQ